jgi:two-component system, NarL family, invasion response regulator UvrY
MPGRSGLEILQQVRLDHPKLPILVLSMHSEDQYAIRVLKAGASSYLNKESAPEELIRAINQLLLGKKYITPSIAEKLAGTLDRDSAKMLYEYLSDREFEVFKLLATGKSVSEIAEKIFLSVSAVSTYRGKVMAKMNLKTNAEINRFSTDGFGCYHRFNVGRFQRFGRYGFWIMDFQTVFFIWTFTFWTSDLR